MFEEQVQKSPDHVALIHNQKSVTYKSLNRRANILSRYIMRYIESQQIVGILCNNSIEMVVGIIAVLKAGCAYLPIEPSLPIERIEYMLKDSSAKVLLVDQNTVKRSNELEFDGQIIMLEEESCEDNVSNTDVEIKPDSLAYIIYTSGTTGVPKGVMINHSSIANAILWRKNEYSLNEGDTVLQLFSYAFDGFLTSLFTPIVSGSSVVIVDNEHVKDVVALKKHIITNKVTHFICVPSLFYELIDYMEPEGLVNIRIVTLAGEKVLPALLEISIRKAPHIELVNEYGPTENSVVSTVYRNMKAENPILIGKPISNVNAYIVNIDNNLLPIGIPGEICLFGKNLARGYLNNDELTNSKFLQMPFLQGRKVYKTGDMGRWISDGNIDYLGRTDNQVKIRGYRIEIEEIEKCLLKHISIKNAVVDVRKKDNGSYYICAFYLAQNELDVHELKLYLKKELPEYMIPEVFVKLDYMPLTSNGKIDRNALPDSVIKYSNSEQIVEAETETEKVILNDWKEVLELDNISINDNFFDIGGNSILLMRVHAKLDKRYPGIFKIADFFSYPNIYQLSQYLKSRCETLIQKETVEWIEFPQSFFADIQEKKSRMYSIDLEKSLIERLICLIKDKNINFNILLLSALMYVLKELSGKNLIVVYKIRNNKLIPIKIDFELLESFEDLFNKVMVESENMENAYNLDVSSSFNLDSNKPQNVVTILFNEMPQDYRFVDEYSIFDLILCYKNISDKYELVFEDSGRIDKNSIKKLVNTYMELLNIISNSY
ncbi:MAG: Gramicidin S synthase 2 [Firmicutes bacterium ADurb.Bin419]|nr:MAG: Gramicidin S synthase 2 [Firmicutes bacterium ADurb.Bin419]